MSWTLEQLRTLVAIADTGSMTLAARERGYTTGAISQQMQALSEITNKTLLVRAGRQVEFTDAGLALLRHGRAVLEADRLAQKALAGSASDLDMQVDLGVFGSAAVVAIPGVTRRLSETAPNIRIRAYEVDVEQMPEAVASGHIDIALGLEYPASPSPLPRGVRSFLLRRELFQVVVAAELEVLRPHEGLPAVTNTAGWILPPNESSYGRACRLALEAADIEPNIRHVVTDTAVALAMAETSMGVTLATPLMCQLTRARVRMAPLPGGSCRDIVAISRQGALGRDSVQAVLEALRSVFADKLAS